MLEIMLNIHQNSMNFILHLDEVISSDKYIYISITVFYQWERKKGQLKNHNILRT